MEKLNVVNQCDCLNKLIILGFLREYDSEEKSSNYYLGEIIDGRIVMKIDIVVDNGYYDENGNYNTYFDIISSYYPIDFCPICGKKIEYVKSSNNSLKLVWQNILKRVYLKHKRRPRGVVYVVY